MLMVILVCGTNDEACHTSGDDGDDGMNSNATSDANSNQASLLSPKPGSIRAA